jgi:hypothetical protein
MPYFLLYVNETQNGGFLYTAYNIHAIYITSVVFPCVVGLESSIDAQSNITVMALIIQSLFFCCVCCRQHNILLVYMSLFWGVFFLESCVKLASWRCRHHHGDLTIHECTECFTNNPSNKSILNFRWFNISSYTLPKNNCRIKNHGVQQPFEQLRLFILFLATRYICSHWAFSTTPPPIYWLQWIKHTDLCFSFPLFAYAWNSAVWYTAIIIVSSLSRLRRIQTFPLCCAIASTFCSLLSCSFFGIAFLFTLTIITQFVLHDFTNFARAL